MMNNYKDNFSFLVLFLLFVAFIFSYFFMCTFVFEKLF